MSSLAQDDEIVLHNTLSKRRKLIVQPSVKGQHKPHNSNGVVLVNSKVATLAEEDKLEQEYNSETVDEAKKQVE